MINDEIVEFMDKLILDASNYELVSDEYVRGLDAMAEALKDFESDIPADQQQELIDATLLHGAEAK